MPMAIMAWRLQLFTRRLCAVAAAAYSAPPRPTRHSLFRRLLTAESESVDGEMEAWVREKKPTSRDELLSLVSCCLSRSRITRLDEVIQEASTLSDSIYSPDRVQKGSKRPRPCTPTVLSSPDTPMPRWNTNQEAESQLKRLQQKMNKSDRDPYHFLITLYAGIGNKEEVQRIWKSLKKQFPKTTNGSYLLMLQTFDKLDNIHALINCFKNWESETVTEGEAIRFDIRIPNVVIGAYLKKDMLSQALVVGEKCMTKGQADIRTVNLFFKYYLKHSKVDLALNWFEKGLELGRKAKWKLSEEMIHEFVKYFEESMDRGDHYELFREKLKEIGLTEGVKIKENEATAVA